METNNATNNRPAIFIDRDNTLIVCDGFLGDPTRVTLVDGASDAVARAKKLGYSVVVVSNQSGVARGMFSEDAVHAVNARLDELLRDECDDAVIDRHEFCPFHPEASIERYRQDSELRKPAPGMLLRAADALRLDLSRSWLIGDAPRDIEAGQAASCRTILFRPLDLAPSHAASAPEKAPPDFTVTSLKEAMDLIEQATEPRPESEPVRETLVHVAALTTPPPSPTPPTSTPDVSPAPASTISRLEKLTEQILHEVKRRNEHPHSDFSVSKLFSGIVQIVALALLFFAYLNRGSPGTQETLLFAIFLQALTVALLIMGRQK